MRKDEQDKQERQPESNTKTGQNQTISNSNSGSAVTQAQTLSAEEKYAFTQKLQHSGKIYLPEGELLEKEQHRCQGLVDIFNATGVNELDKRSRLMQEMFASSGEHNYIEPPLHANFGGKYVHLGDFIYMNSNVTLVDDTYIYIGDHTMIGPNVVIATAAHPVAPKLRALNLQYNLSVTIGSNCWIGAGALIMPGVTIGDNSVIGAGSVVTKDVPANVVAFGNPCRVHREISTYDDKYYKNQDGVTEIDYAAIETELDNAK